MLKEEEDWSEQHLQSSLTNVWRLLVNVSARPGQDGLCMEAIRFLVTVARSGHHSLFSDPSVMTQIIESIVIPNMKLRDEDEENFDMNFIEYVRRDAEGSDSDTRRRLACELMKALVEVFQKPVTETCTRYVSAMLQEYYANPAAQWKAKDCAVYLVTALTVRGTTQAMGATKTNELVNVTEFFTTHIARDLTGEGTGSPILTADALRFTTTFRMQLEKKVLLPLLPSVIKLLASDSNVVHSYAATLLERLLAMKENGQPRFNPDELSPLLQSMLENLFGALSMPDSEENEYVMKAIMRVVSFLGPRVEPVAVPFVQMIGKVLHAGCANPRNPAFSHFMFESLAGVVRHALSKNPGLADAFEGMIFPAIDQILQKEVQEYAPYAFQVMALLLELRPAPAPAVYLQLLPPLLTPAIWENSGNIPALVRLLSAYLMRAPEGVVAGGHLLPTLGVFQKLNATKAFDHGGFAILEALVEHLELAAYEQHLPTILSLVFTRLQSSRTKKYVRCFVVFLSKLIVKVGGQAVVDRINAVQPGLAASILTGVFAPGLGSVHGSEEEQAAVLAAAGLLCDTRDVGTWPQGAAVWGAVAKGAVELLAREEEAFSLKRPEDELEELLAGGYSSSFAQLANAARTAGPGTPDVGDLGGYLVRRLAEFSQGRPGQVGPALLSAVPQELHAAVQGWMAKAGASLA